MTPPPPPLSDLLHRHEADLERLRAVMHSHLGADVDTIAEMETADYLTGGKRLRAIVALLAARLCGIPQGAGDTIAVAIEFIHTATLLHDDVVDDAPMRRHHPAASRVYGNAAAVLAGDFLYSRASQLLAQLGNLPLLARIADATNQLAQGELIQLKHRGRPDMDETTYHTIIARKTANLFSAAAAAPALLAGADDSALSAYGNRLGTAFQLTDDCLDYEGEDAATGKKIGADFSEGKMTLPVIRMLRRLPAADQTALRRDWQNGAAFPRIAALLRDTGALAETRRLAQDNTDAAAAALAAYADSPAKTTLSDLARATARRHR